MVLFEDALKAGTLVEDLWSNASVRTTPVVDLAPQVGSHPDLGAWCGVREDLFQSNIGGPNGHAVMLSYGQHLKAKAIKVLWC